MARMICRRLVTRYFWLLLLMVIAAVVTTFAAGGNQGPGLCIRLAPSSDGCVIFLWAEVVGEEGTPTGMTCGQNCQSIGCDASGCSALLTGLSPDPLPFEGTLSVTLTLSPTQTLESGPLNFRRFYVPTSTTTAIVSDDESLALTLEPDTLPCDAYIVVVPSGAPPGPVLLGHQLVGKPYSVRPSGAVVTSTKPMWLELGYTDVNLGDVDPHTLSVFQWHSAPRVWEDLGGTLDDLFDHSVTTTTDRFTVYALMATTRWRDIFNDFTGLSLRENVTILLPNGELILDGTALTGTAISRAITPTVSIETWGTVAYTRTVPAGTSLTIDVLDANDSVVLSDVANGASLAALTPSLCPSLKLRANLATDDIAITPRLDEWSITWQPGSYKTHLPIILKQ